MAARGGGGLSLALTRGARRSRRDGAPRRLWRSSAPRPCWRSSAALRGVAGDEEAAVLEELCSGPRHPLGERSTGRERGEVEKKMRGRESWGSRSGGRRARAGAGEASRVHERSSIVASLLSQAEEPFPGQVGTAQVVKPGYQTRESGLRRDFLSWPGLPNTPLTIEDVFLPWHTVSSIFF